MTVALTSPTTVRRTLLTAGAAALIGGSAIGTSAALRALNVTTRDREADAVFTRWLDLVREIERRDHGRTEDVTDALVSRLNALEDEMAAGPPCVTRAAAVALAACLKYAGHPPAGAAGWRWSCPEAFLALTVLPLLRPHLLGTVEAVTAAVLDHPDRPLRVAFLAQREGGR